MRVAARVLPALVVLFLVHTVEAAKGGGAYTTGFARWSSASGGFASWTRSGVRIDASGALVLDVPAAAAGADPYAPGAYSGGNFYNGATFVVGEATSPIVTPASPFFEAIPSWNATTPAGTWVETQLRARVGGVWTKWYNLGVWDDDNSTVRRHSVTGQGDTAGSVAVDTLKLNTKKGTADAIQLKLRLFSDTGVNVPSVRNASVATSSTPVQPSALQAGDPAKWNRLLNVPQCSQMVYPDGGNVWCSPTSTSMVLAFLQNDTGACEPRVRAAVSGVHDWIFGGHGNWPFNTAYASTKGFNAYVARFTSMRDVENWVAAGVPVVFSFAWSSGQLTGSAIPSSSGHLAVFVGFDASGNPIVNDPAAASDGTVRRTYLRSELEPLWLSRSGGTVYLIYPQGLATPAGH
ncbi:MAG TPA: C39 family peptidase [Thermoanaerobaculia bacterium]|nr:C39 family peptidase [Thermoanaerobaculia bacterium]